MDAKYRIIAEQRELIEELKLALAKATKDSSNSSKSPSSDIVKPPKRDARSKTGRKKRKRGGQRGHKRTLREPLPPDCKRRSESATLAGLKVQRSGGLGF